MRLGLSFINTKEKGFSADKGTNTQGDETHERNPEPRPKRILCGAAQ